MLLSVFGLGFFSPQISFQMDQQAPADLVIVRCSPRMEFAGAFQEQNVITVWLKQILKDTCFRTEIVLVYHSSQKISSVLRLCVSSV